MFIYDLSILLTSTAFVDTNAKQGIPFQDMPYFQKLSLRATRIFLGSFASLGGCCSFRNHTKKSLFIDDGNAERARLGQL